MAKPIASRITVEVVYALPSRQRMVTLELEPETTARAAVLQSELTEWFPELDLAACPLGIFGVQVADQQVLKHGDRVELYRDLLSDPRATRRAAAQAGSAMRLDKPGR